MKASARANTSTKPAISNPRFDPSFANFKLPCSYRADLAAPSTRPRPRPPSLTIGSTALRHAGRLGGQTRGLPVPGCPGPANSRGSARLTVDYSFSHLQALEAEAVYVFREVAAQFERPALLFSGGKDSVAMLRIAEKAFWPAPIPFPLLHIDTGHNFPEVIAFRDETVRKKGLRIFVASVQAAIDSGRVQDRPGASRNPLQTVALLDAISNFSFDAVFGGGRRDEDKARAKERVFSFRDEFGQWEPKNQRPELWSLYNGRHHPGEHIRIFPLSNWTELDVWSYLADEQVDLPGLYFAHNREVFRRDGMLLAVGPFSQPRSGEEVAELRVRYRTVGDMTCTGAIESAASSYAEVIAEVAATRITERGATRADDRVSEAAMEDRKRAGYF